MTEVDLLAAFAASVERARQQRRDAAWTARSRCPQCHLREPAHQLDCTRGPSPEGESE